MKLLLLIVAISVTAYADKLSECNCGDGYEPKVNENGEVECNGILVRAIQPCNVLQRPRCVCGEDVTGITTDQTGTWCGKYREGKLLKRWECLNREEWENFYRKHPHSRP